MSNEVQQQTQTPAAMEVVVHTPGGDVRLNPMIVRKYLVSGQGAVTDQEIALFLGLCKAQNLNPFVREAYLIKYGNNQPAAIVVAKEVFLKRACRSESFRGHKAGIICKAPEQPELLYTQGVCPPGARIVGGWAEVHVDGWQFPLRVEVDFAEYQAKKSDGTVNRMWSEKPATMIRKVALVQALREAFPDSVQGMYTEEEVPVQGELPSAPVDAGAVIDVASADPDAAGPPPESGRENRQASPEYRRRRHKFKADPVIFGAGEILTCGCTADQLMELHAIAKGDPSAKARISEWVKNATGYDQWSFMKHAEAEELLDLARSLFAAPDGAPPNPAVIATAPETAQNGGVGDAAPRPPITPDHQALLDDLVECPMNPGDLLSVSRYCKVQCRERKAHGWCPAVPGDEPPAVEGEML